MKLTTKFPNGVEVELDLDSPDGLASAGIDPNPLKIALKKALEEVSFSSGATVTNSAPMSPATSNSPSEQPDPWMAQAPVAAAPPQPPVAQQFPTQATATPPPYSPQSQQYPPPQQSYSQPANYPPATQQMPPQQAATVQYPQYANQPPLPVQPQQPMQPSQPGVVQVNSQNGPQTWTLSAPGAPMCMCGMPSAFVQATGKNGRPYKAWRCAKGSGNDWRSKCQFNQFT